jgi:hypothetical protein
MSTVRPISTKEVVVSAEEIKGLCATCNAASDCAIRKDCNKPIWFCEEFDDYVVVADRTPKQALQQLLDPPELQLPDAGLGNLVL